MAIIQELTGKVVSCHEGQPHQIPTGAPLDPASHSCSATSPEDILLPCLTSPANSLRTHVCWSCFTCKRTYRGTTASCGKAECSGKQGSSYAQVARRFTGVATAVAAQTAPMWNAGQDTFPEVLSPEKLCELLLSPHGNRLSGMQHGAWTLQEDEGKCSCTSNTEEPDLVPSTATNTSKEQDEAPKSMEVDLAPPELLSTTTPSSKTIDSEAFFAVKDVREKQKGIKLTLKVPKKYQKKKKSKKSKSPPPPPPPAVPSTGPSNPKKPKKSMPPPPPPAPKVSSDPSPPVKPPSTNFQLRNRGKVLLPLPDASPDTSPQTPATPNKSTATAKHKPEPVKDKEPGSESRGNPETWGMWWCWISECGYANQLPQDWCSHCGHSKYAREGNIHLNNLRFLVNNLKRKLADISGGAE